MSIRIWKIVRRQQQKVMSAHSVELLYYAAGLSRALIVNKVVLRFFFWGGWETRNNGKAGNNPICLLRA